MANEPSIDRDQIWKHTQDWGFSCKKSLMSSPTYQLTSHAFGISGLGILLSHYYLFFKLLYYLTLFVEF